MQLQILEVVVVVAVMLLEWDIVAVMVVLD
jgi:hypothetical protein